MKLSIIIPAYNEEKRIKKTLGPYYNFFKSKLGNDFELIVVPNNCKDNTLGIVKEFSKDKKNIVIENIEKINGKGLAVMRGFSIAKGDLIGFVDVDESTSPEEFYKLCKNIGNYDGVIASRRKKGAVISPKRPAYKDLSGIAFNLVVRLLFNLPYQDTQCGAKLFRKDLAHFLSKNVKETKYSFDVELLYLCKKKNKKILEYPIHWVEVGGGYVTLTAGLEAVLRVIELRFRSLFK